MTEINRNVIDNIVDMYNNKINFNKFVGLQCYVDELYRAIVKVKINNDLLGNYVYKTLHGGFIATVLDTVGSLQVLLDIVCHNEKLTDAEKLEKASKLGTIDLRIDYLRPGLGDEFISTAETLRVGNKIAVVRTFIKHNEKLIAAGTGTYIVG